MTNSKLVLSDALEAYRTALANWLMSIRHEESLIGLDRSISNYDKWQAPIQGEESAREVIQTARSAYENTFRRLLYGF